MLRGRRSLRRLSGDAAIRSVQPFRLLLLAGTAEARALAGALAARTGIAPLAALAGATEAPAAYPIPTRRGGFGGAEALSAFLATEGFDAVIDATHPFAARISANAAAAARALGLPVLRLSRPPWRPGPDDRWIDVADTEAAAAALPPGSVAFLATGRSAWAAFAARPDLRLVLRVIDAPPDGLPASATVLRGRPPFTTEEEIDALRRLGATHLVSKNAGGAGGRAKLEAARALRLPVVMIARPPAPPGVATVETVADALTWIVHAAGRG